MIPVRCRTNLDLRGERWPTKLHAVPEVGTLIRSTTAHRQNDSHSIYLELKVCAVVQADVCLPVEIELGLPYMFKCMSHFDLWYERICTGRGADEFYQRRMTEILRSCNHGRPIVQNPDLIHDLAKAITGLYPELRALPQDDNTRFKLHGLERVLGRYEGEEKLFPMEIRYSDGKQEVISDAASLPVTRPFEILKKGYVESS